MGPIDNPRPEEIAQGRPSFGGTNLLVVPHGSYRSITVFGPTDDSIYYFPFSIPTPITLAKLFIEVTTAAGAGNKAQLGIYKADKDWQPEEIVLPSVEVAIDAIAVVSGTYVVTLQPGRYLMAFNEQATANLRVYFMFNGNDGIPRTMGAVNADLWFVASAYGALPDPGTPWDTVREVNGDKFFPILLDITTP